MNPREIAAVMAGIAPVIRDQVAKGFEGPIARIHALETRSLIPPEKGERGEKGDKGDDGEGKQGEKGEQGPQSEPGAPGEPGQPGAPGRPGEKGEKGDQGLEGSAGRDGIDGKDGVPGQPGDPGRPGEKGEAGEKGLDGSPGRDGIDGKDGAPGERGEKGLDGKDIDPTLVERLLATVEGFQTEIKTLSSEIAAFKALPVAPASFVINEEGALLAVYPDGTTKSIGMARGDDGERGASIMDGTVDGAGQLVLRMSDGRVLNAGIVRGEPGRNGRDGERGLAGRDAAEIMILPGIDESKSYSERVCARYRGGVIRAERQTDPIEDGDIVRAGWSVILEGVAEEVERSLDDERTLERTTTYTSGRAFTRRIETARQIYRGIWREGAYQRGDTVTRQGAMWHCERETTDTPGTGSLNWTMCVKSGRQGKDGSPGPKGDKGMDAKPVRMGAY